MRKTCLDGPQRGTPGCPCQCGLDGVGRKRLGQLLRPDVPAGGEGEFFLGCSECWWGKRRRQHAPQGPRDALSGSATDASRMKQLASLIRGSAMTLEQFAAHRASSTANDAVSHSFIGSFSVEEGKEGRVQALGGYGGRQESV